jgi:hypothetical protein
MTPTKIIYCTLDGFPNLFVGYEDGSTYGFEYRDGKWEDVHPADVFTKAPVIGETAFKIRFPGLELPACCGDARRGRPGLGATLGLECRNS